MRRKHHDLIAWQQGIILVKQIYRLTAEFPESEKFGLSSQMRRAAVSVPANIAEGVIARELGYSSGGQQVLELDRVFALVNGLMNAERRKVPAK